MMIRCCVFSFAFCFAGNLVCGDDPRVFELVDAASINFDVDQLGSFEQKLAADIEKGRIVGAMALIARGDKVAYAKTWGHRDREENLPMTEDTIHRIFSMTKPITTVAAMQLVEQGKIELDAPVAKYLPAFADLKVKEMKAGNRTLVTPNRAPTVRDLCRHTAGLTYGVWTDQEITKRYWSAPGARSIGSAAALAKKLSKYPLEYHPGTKWQYSYATDVLAEVVEVVSGQRFDKYLEQHIFQPLDMPDTFFFVPKEKRGRFARSYAPDGPDALKPIPTKPEDSFTNPENQFFSGGGGLCSTTNDYFRFCKAMLFGGELEGKRILKTDTVARMFSRQLDDSVQTAHQSLLKEGYNFGLGFAVTEDGMGWGGAAGTRFIISPSRNLIAIYMTQISPYQDRNYGEEFMPYVLMTDQRTPN